MIGFPRAERYQNYPTHLESNETRSRVLPVADVDRAKRFYVALGWRLDADNVTGDDFRVVQLTAFGSPCSIISGVGIAEPEAGPVTGLQLAVLTSKRPELH